MTLVVAHTHTHTLALIQLIDNKSGSSEVGLDLCRVELDSLSLNT